MSSRRPRGPIGPTHHTPRSSPPSWWQRQLGVLLGVAAGLGVCVLAFVVVHAISGPQVPPPAPAAQAICADLERQDYADLFTRLAPTQRAIGTQQQFVASQQELDRLRGQVASCTYTLPSVRAGAATARLTIIRGSSAPTQAAVELGVEHGMWQIESYDTSAV